jgi:hypothetical protein
MERLRIIITGLIAQHPHMGGVAWDYVQYALGLRLLGHDVFYFEDSGEWPYNLDGGKTGDDWAAPTPDWNLAHLSAIMKRFGLAERWAYRFPREDTWHGLSETKRREVLATADLLINVSGTIEHPERYREIPRMAYIDSDPLFTQIKYLQKNSEFPRGWTCMTPISASARRCRTRFLPPATTGCRRAIRWCSTSGAPQNRSARSIPQ